MCCTSGIFFSSARTASIRPRVSSNEASGAVLNLIWNSAWSGFAMNSDCSVPKSPIPATKATVANARTDFRWSSAQATSPL